MPEPEELTLVAHHSSLCLLVLLRCEHEEDVIGLEPADWYIQNRQILPKDAYRLQNENRTCIQLSFREQVPYSVEKGNMVDVSTHASFVEG